MPRTFEPPKRSASTLILSTDVCVCCQEEARMQGRITTWLRIGLFFVAWPVAITGAADDKPAAKHQPSNRLAKETSPYLLLHAHNPVDWYPWGPEALARAKAENKPIFLSVGYSSCYWCHVMERESFVDPEIAKALNASFVCIKVDREERPDVDQVYMAALQAFGPGGWPMSLFLTPDGRPFFGGTYFPPRERQGSPGFLTVVTAVAKAWTSQQAEINKTADQATEAVRSRLKASSQRKLPLSRSAGAEGVRQLAEQFDPEHGGFGYNPANPRRPKFPQPVDLLFLLSQQNRGGVRTNDALDPLKMVVMTLDRMARGGIRDHLDGGYHRYSTDRFWLVPHFEKMLYDNAQLASVHLAAFEITHDPRCAEAEATFSFIERRLTAPEGGFYSALDAETKGEEGAYYVWTVDEVKRTLEDEGTLSSLPRSTVSRVSQTLKRAGTFCTSPGPWSSRPRRWSSRRKNWRLGCDRCASCCWRRATSGRPRCATIKSSRAGTA